MNITVDYICAESVRQQLAAKDKQIALLRDDLDEREKQIVMLREFTKLLRDYVPASAVGNMTVQEALAATDDLSGYIICDAEPVGWNDDSLIGYPLYKARTK